jgi:hypothetical protein
MNRAELPVMVMLAVIAEHVGAEEDHRNGHNQNPCHLKHLEK